MQICGKRVGQHIDVGEVGGGDDHNVAEPTRQETAIIGELRCRIGKALLSCRNRLRMRISQRCHDAIVEMNDVVDVLAPHHPCADYAVAQNSVHRMVSVRRMSIHDANLVDATPRSLAGHTVGALAFGCWRFTTTSVSSAQELVEAALDSGCNLVDTADVYGFDWGGAGFGACEDLLGKVFGVAPRLRHKMVLATKGGIWPGVPYNSSSDYLTAACEASLRRLGTDYVELYQVHRPDPFTHPVALAETLRCLVERGLVGAVGVSNTLPSQTEALAAALSEVGLTLASVQPELSPAHLDPLRDATLDVAMRMGQTVLAWSPLAGGRLMNGEGVRPELIGVLDELAHRENVDRAAICLAFVLAFPSRPIAIVGTQQIARLRDSWSAANVHLSRPDVYSIIQASDGVGLP